MPQSQSQWDISCRQRDWGTTNERYIPIPIPCTKRLTAFYLVSDHLVTARLRYLCRGPLLQCACVLRVDKREEHSTAIPDDRPRPHSLKEPKADARRATGAREQTMQFVLLNGCPTCNARADALLSVIPLMSTTRTQTTTPGG